MLVSQKAQYALRALLELARQRDSGPVKVADIAEAQGIPPQFLTAILGQLRQAGLVESHRGREGGYTLRRSPSRLTVGQVLELVQGPSVLVDCLSSNKHHCATRESCVFFSMWRRVEHAMSDVLDGTTLQALVEQAERGRQFIPDYHI
jgi:Rrf2 family protein